MSRIRLLLVLAFVLVFAAGAVVETVREKRAHKPQDDGPFRDLNLSDAQKRQMKSIWDGVMEMRKQIDSRRQQLEHKREDEVLKVLTPRQRTEYEQVQQRFRAEREELDRQFHQAVMDADQTTRALLTPEQQQKFDEIRRDRPPRMHRGFGRHGPTSAPASRRAPSS